MTKVWVAALIAIITLIGFIYYGPFLKNFFYTDDFWILENASGDFHRALFGYFNLRVTGNILLWLNYQFFGYNPVGYNIISIVTHIANSSILFIFLYLLTDNRLLSTFTAAIFAASAVGSDAVFWKAAYSTEVGFFFYVLVLYLYVRWKKIGDLSYRRYSLVIFVIAMFNKEEIASIPIMIILIEILFFEGINKKKLLVKSVVPYLVVIASYIVLSKTVSYFSLPQEQFERFLKFRPLHSLFSGFAAFYISPEGSFRLSDPFLYLSFLLLPASFLLVKNRSLLIFCYCWVFITFLPQSLTGLAMSAPKYLLHSISRYLYIPSAGVAMVFAMLLLSIRERFGKKHFVIICCFFFLAFISLNYSRVQVRGEKWLYNGNIMKRFIHSLIKVQSTFPENSYVYVVDGPLTNRAYMQRALRGFYKNHTIYWVDDPYKANLKKGDSLFIIFYNRARSEVAWVWKVK